MTLLDRFRAQPRQKHPDPAVRLAYLAELPIEDHHAIAAMAREDPEPRVRRTAVEKLMDPALLGAIAQSDTDDSVKARAIDMLRDLAVEAFEGLGELEGLAAVDVLVDLRALTQVAKTAPRESIALRALSRVTDSRMLGSIARHAAGEPARLAALGALRDRHERSEILGVALNGEFKDAAAGAVDLLTDRPELEQVATRSKNKNAVKRARTILREIDERASRDAVEQAAAANAARAAAHAESQEVQSSMSTDALIDPTSPSVPAATASDPVATAGHDEPPPASLEPERAETARVETAGDEPEREPDAADRRTDDEAAAEPARQAAVPDVPVVPVVPVVDEAAARDARRLARLGELADEAAAAAGLDDLLAARKRFTAVRREWVDLSAAGAVDETLTTRYTEADAAFTARDVAAQESELKARREGLARMHNLLGRVEQLSARPDVSLKAADRALRDVRAALGAIPPLPSKADYDDVSGRLKVVQDLLAPKVNELREADEWQKWANVTVQEQLCVRMEALNALEDPEAIAREVRELQQQWRQSADVPRDKADGLWRRFKAAHDTVWAKCESHFAAEAQARAENLTKKAALCEQAEGLAESTNWIQTAEAIKQLQAEWKIIGPVSRGREKAIWDRFRTACDRFFTRRHEDLAQRKGVWAENLARKDALCARAEVLSESTDWDAASAEIKRLQAEWKNVGPVKKSRSEAIWQRFRSACDRFFERYAQRHDTARAERAAAREAICAEVEALVSADEVTEPPADLLNTVRSLRGRWQQEIAARGVDPDRARALDARFADAFSRLVARWPQAFSGTDLDPDANRKRMETLVKKIEELAASLSGPVSAPDASLSPATRLAAMLKEALAANTIGGKVEDDSRWRAAAEDVRQAQAAWSRLGPVPEQIRRQLADRFQRASRKITDRAEAASRAAAPGRTGDAGRPPSRSAGPTNRPGGPPNRGGGSGRPAGTDRPETRQAAVPEPRPEHVGTEN